MVFETLGARIAHTRGGLTQAEFAERLGVSRNTLVRYENDRRTPTAEVLQVLVAEFGVDANWLLLGVGEPPKPELTPREAALLDNYRHSPEDARRNLEKTSALLAQHSREDEGMKDAG